MSNRKKIEKFCKDKGLKLLHCEFIRESDYCYGDHSDASYWHVEVEINGKVEEYISLGSDIIAEGVDDMLKSIQGDIDNPDESEG